MRSLKYQLKSVWKDKFCLMSFLLPILAAAALNLMGSIDLSSLGQLHFGVLEEDLPGQTVAWLERYGPVTYCKTPTELINLVNDPSTNVIGVKADGTTIKTMIAGDELEVFRQAAATLPALFEQQADARQTKVLVLESPDVLENLQDIFIPAILIVAMFMGCTFNAMNIISEKEDGVAFVNEILPMPPARYVMQKIAVGFLFCSLSSVITACICLRLSPQTLLIMLVLILLSSFLSSLIGLLIGRISDSLMTGVACIKVVMLLFIAVPVLCTLTGASGPVSIICNLVPSRPAFEGIMALSAGNTKAAMENTGILAIHSILWCSLYILFPTRRKGFLHGSGTKTGN